MPLCLYVKEHACNDLYCDITPTCIPFCCLPEDGSERAKWCRTFYSTYILLLQSALQPLWVLSCSTIPEYSQQEGFYRVPLPAARQTPNLENQWLERFNSRHQAPPHAWNDASEPQQRKVELWARNGWEFCRKWRLPRHFWVILRAVNLRHGTFWRKARWGFFRPKSPTASAGFEPANLGTRGQHAYL